MEDVNRATAKNILVVDDAHHLLNGLQKCLADAGYRVMTASDGPQALHLVRAKRPDLVLLDLMMPGMDGYTVCERLKVDEQTHDLPVIVISAVSDVRDKTRVFSLGAVDYVTRPFQVEEILARVKIHLKLKAARASVRLSEGRVQKWLYHHRRTYPCRWQCPVSPRDCLWQPGVEGTLRTPKLG